MTAAAAGPAAAGAAGAAAAPAAGHLHSSSSSSVVPLYMLDRAKNAGITQVGDVGGNEQSTQCNTPATATHARCLLGKRELANIHQPSKPAETTSPARYAQQSVHSKAILYYARYPCAPSAASSTCGGCRSPPPRAFPAKPPPAARPTSASASLRQACASCCCSCCPPGASSEPPGQAAALGSRLMARIKPAKQQLQEKSCRRG